MKLLFIFLFSLFTSFYAQATAKPYLVCLGNEETYIHKHKIGGAFYKLNQDIISALIQLSDSTQIQPKLLKQVCAKKFVSLEILKLMISSKENIFYTTKLKGNIEQRTIDEHNLKELKEKVIFIFIDFLNKVQAGQSDPKCLTKKIPELKTFFEKSRYILEDIGPEELVKTIKDPDVIFKKLETINANGKC